MAVVRFCSLMILFLLSLCTTGAAPALAADVKRVALVIGNSTYERVTPLPNPANDATDVAQKLKGLGFEVLVATNANQEKMGSLLDDFRKRVTPSHVALFFFAGHGVTVNSESFLLPVDAPDEIDLDERSDARA